MSNWFRHLIWKKKPCSHAFMPLYHWEQKIYIYVYIYLSIYLLLSTVGASYLLCLSLNTKCAPLPPFFTENLKRICVLLASAPLELFFLFRNIFFKKEKKKGKRKKEKKYGNCNPFPFGLKAMDGGIVSRPLEIFFYSFTQSVYF